MQVAYIMKKAVFLRIVLTAAVLALLDHCYAEAAASALVALLLCPYGVPQLLFWAGGILIYAATILYHTLYRM